MDFDFDFSQNDFFRGFQEGFEKGFQEGFKEGFEEGSEKGFERGFEKGKLIKNKRKVKMVFTPFASFDDCELTVRKLNKLISEIRNT